MDTILKPFGNTWEGNRSGLLPVYGPGLKLNTSHPLCDGLLCCFIAAENRFVDLVKDRSCVETSPGQAVPMMGQRGYYLSAASDEGTAGLSCSNALTADLDIANYSQWTVAIFAFLIGSTTHSIMQRDNSPSLTVGYEWANISGTPTFSSGTGSGATSRAIGGIGEVLLSCSTGDRATLHFTFPGTAASQIGQYRSSGVTSAAAAPAADTSDALFLGGINQGLALFMVWDRAVQTATANTGQGLDEIYFNPSCIFLSQEPEPQTMDLLPPSYLPLRRPRKLTRELIIRR